MRGCRCLTGLDLLCFVSIGGPEQSPTQSGDIMALSVLPGPTCQGTAAILRELGTADKPGTTEAPDGEQRVGLHLRSLRTRQRLSLADVAERTGLSISFLSAVERGQASISLGNRFKLADAYGTTVPGLNPAYQRPATRVSTAGTDGGGQRVGRTV
jgi:hypothetical protein